MQIDCKLSNQNQQGSTVQKIDKQPSLFFDLKALFHAA